MTNTDAGQARNYWHRYYEPDEIAECEAHTTTTMLTSGRYPIHVRIWEQPEPASTVVIGSSVLSYGLHLLRLQAPFFRAGFNVVQFDFPGLGQSGGPRGGCSVPEFLDAWRQVLAHAGERFGTPLYIMGVGEDGITGYYVGANRPDVAAISVRMLVEYGQPGMIQGQGPFWLVRAKAFGTRLGAFLRPSTEFDAMKVIHWDWVFSGPDDGPRIELLANDPLSLRRIQLKMVSSILQRHVPPVPFEQCRTPVQAILSTSNRVCPYELASANFARLSGPKDLVVQAGVGQWQLDRAFNDTYCEQVIRWFDANGAHRIARDRVPEAHGSASR